MVVLDDRLKLSPDAISTRRREPDDFRIKYYHAASIARAQGPDCVLYVDTTEGSSAHHGLTFVTRMVWQGRNDIPRIFVPKGDSAMLNTFLLDMTDFAGRTNCSQPLVIQSLIDHVTDLCQNQYDSLSQFDRLNGRLSSQLPPDRRFRECQSRAGTRRVQESTAGSWRVDSTGRKPAHGRGQSGWAAFCDSGGIPRDGPRCRMRLLS